MRIDNDMGDQRAQQTETKVAPKGGLQRSVGFPHVEMRELNYP